MTKDKRRNYQKENNLISPFSKDQLANVVIDAKTKSHNNYFE